MNRLAAGQPAAGRPHRRSPGKTSSRAFQAAATPELARGLFGDWYSRSHRHRHAPGPFPAAGNRAPQRKGAGTCTTSPQQGQARGYRQKPGRGQNQLVPSPLASLAAKVKQLAAPLPKATNGLRGIEAWGPRRSPRAAADKPPVVIVPLARGEGAACLGPQPLGVSSAVTGARAAAKGTTRAAASSNCSGRQPQRAGAGDQIGRRGGPLAPPLWNDSLTDVSAEPFQQWTNTCAAAVAHGGGWARAKGSTAC